MDEGGVAHGDSPLLQAVCPGLEVARSTGDPLLEVLTALAGGTPMCLASATSLVSGDLPWHVDLCHEPGEHASADARHPGGSDWRRPARSSRRTRHRRVSAAAD